MFRSSAPNVYMERKAEPACIFTVPRSVPRLEGPHRGYGRAMRRHGKACPDSVARCLREGDRNRLSSMEIPRLIPLANRAAHPAVSPRGDRKFEASEAPERAPKPPFGRGPAGGFVTPAQADAPPVCGGDEWPDGD